MKNFDPIVLSHFIGTERYYRLSRKHLITDGTKYLADNAECYWLLDATTSHLMEIGTNDWFVLATLSVKDSRATLIYSDGNGNELARQQIPYTDFPMEQIKLYCCYDGEHCHVRISGSLQAVKEARLKIPGESLPGNEDFWQLLREQQLSFFHHISPLYRVMVKPATPSIAIEGSWLLDWGGAQRWLYSDTDLEAVADYISGLVSQ
jgi:hypothetical protein